MRRVYLDANATTPLLPEVLEAMRPYWLERFGNASSIHLEGQHARAAVEHARESVATLLGSRPAEIVFTSGGTEGDNLALFGMVKPGDHLITSADGASCGAAQRRKAPRSRSAGNFSAGERPGRHRSGPGQAGSPPHDQADQHHDGQQ